MDNLTSEQRSKCMSRIRSTDSTVEVVLRKYLWNQGLKGYRKNVKLLGKPDLYYGKKRLAVFIDGCFWHKCPKCFVKPKSQNKYWDAKIDKNVRRDKENTKLLRREGIYVIRIWEHEIKKSLDKSFLKVKNKYEKLK